MEQCLPLFNLAKDPPRESDVPPEADRVVGCGPIWKLAEVCCGRASTAKTTADHPCWAEAA